MKLFMVNANYADEFDVVDMLILTEEEVEMWNRAIENFDKNKVIEIYFSTNEYVTMDRQKNKNDIKIIDISNEIVNFLKENRLLNRYVAGDLFDAVVYPEDENEYDAFDEIGGWPA